MAIVPLWVRQDNITLTVTSLEASNSTTANATLALLANLALTQSRSIRNSTIILAAFNIVTAAATAFSILYDCYLASARNGKITTFRLSAIHPAETFPLILSIAIVIQGLIFAAIQSFGLNSTSIDGCSAISQVLFPVIFLVPLIQVVFGLESALRSLRSLPFQSRGRYDVIICLSAVVLTLIGIWIPTFLNPQPDHCFGQLAFFIQRYGLEGLVIIGIIMLLMILSAVVIFYRLMAVSMIDQHQRIAASRMVYYLVLGFVSLAFVAPWFVKLVSGGTPLLISMMATVVLNLSGILNCGLQLFLRTNTAATSIKPKGAALSIQKHDIRIWGPNELGFSNALFQPVSGPRRSGSINSQASLVRKEKESTLSPFIRSPSRFNPLSANAKLSLPSSPRPTAMAQYRHKQKPSYSLFPAGSTKEVKRESILEQPPPLHLIGGGGGGHRRESSIFSSATVQIGLRLSHAIDDDMPETPRLQVNTQNLDEVRPDARMKTLPPTPNMSQKIASPIQLSPSVYTPNSKKTARFAQPDPVVRSSKADWI